MLTPEGRQSVGLTRCLEEGLGRSVICGWVESLLRKEIFNDDSCYYKVAKSVQNRCTSRTLTWVLVVRTHLELCVVFGLPSVTPSLLHLRVLCGL